MSESYSIGDVKMAIRVQSFLYGGKMLMSPFTLSINDEEQPDGMVIGHLGVSEGDAIVMGLDYNKSSRED